MTVSTIGTLASEDYTTIAAWEAAAAATLTAPWEGTLSKQEFTAAGNVCTFAGITASATNFIELRPASASGFKDDAGAASNPLRYDAAKGAAVRNTAAYTDAIDIQISYVRLRGLQIACSNSSAGNVLRANDSGLSGVLIRDCIIENTTSNGSTPVFVRSGTLENCLVVQRGSGNGVDFGYAGTVAATNCTVVRPSDISAAVNAFRKDTGTPTLTNCAGFGFNAFTDGSGYAGSNNASDKTISFGTSNQASLTYSSQFEVVTDATRDFRVKSTLSAGTGINGNGTTGTTGDIIGQAASGTKDIGCWELQAAAANSITAANTLGALTSAAAAKAIASATSTPTLAAATSAATVELLAQINAANTLDGLTSEATVTEGAVASATAANTLADATSAAAAKAIASATSAPTLAALTSSATVTELAQIVAANDLAPLTSSALLESFAGTIEITAANTLGDLTSSAAINGGLSGKPIRRSKLYLYQPVEDMTVAEVKKLYREAKQELPATIQLGLLNEAPDLFRGRREMTLPPISRLSITRLKAELDLLKALQFQLQEIERLRDARAEQDYRDALLERQRKSYEEETARQARARLAREQDEEDEETIINLMLL